MGKEDYKRVMALGAWLERFLATSLSPWNIERLVDDALSLLNIDHVRSDDDPVVTAIAVLLEDPDVFSKMRKMKGDPLTVNRFDLKQYAHVTKYTDAEFTDISLDIYQTFFSTQHISRAIRELQTNPDTPWEYTLSKPIQHRDDSHTLMRTFLYRYNNVREVLVEKGRRIAMVNKMIFPGKAEWIRFPTLASRIFITFLLEGGRDYGRLCNNCDKFILAERRGQRQYCSSRCRVAYSRKTTK